MPRRCENESVITNFIVKIYRGVTYIETFTYLNPDGSPIDLSDLSVIFGLRGIFHNTFKLTSGDSPTSLGSFVEIIDAPNGKIRVVIPDEETLTANLSTGAWWLAVGDVGLEVMLYTDKAEAVDV